MTNYSSAIKRIKDCRSNEDFKAMEKSIHRCYENEVFTPTQYGRLCVRLMEIWAKLKAKDAT